MKTIKLYVNLIQDPIEKPPIILLKNHHENEEIKSLEIQEIIRLKIGPFLNPKQTVATNIEKPKKSSLIKSNSENQITCDQYL